MNQLSLKFVYQNLTIDEKQKVINLWTNANVISAEAAKQRLDQVALIVYDADNVVGVSTVYIHDFTMINNPYFFYRMFIDKEYRGNEKLYIQIIQNVFKNLKNKFSSSSHGLVAELENQKLARLGQKGYMKEKGFTYYGKSPRGLQLWYVRFDEPKGIFA